MADEVRHALGGGKKSGKTHTHGVHYERAGNGGFIAHVHKHHGKGPHSEGHSHTEEHALPDQEAAGEHFDEHMGDQPAVGAMPPQGAPDQGEPQEAAAGAGAGPGAGAGMPGM